jgi:uncharacterized protein (TIGR03437 family)
VMRMIRSETRRYFGTLALIGLSVGSATVVLAQPTVTPAGVVNGASYTSPVVAGGLAAIFGTNLASSTDVYMGALPFPTTLAGTSVEIGGHAAAEYFVSSGQINVQIPWELAGRTHASLTVTTGAGTSSPVTVNLAPYAPALSGAIINSDNTLNGPTNPTIPGGTVQISATDLGPVTNQPADGAAPSSNTSSATTTAVTATIGGLAAVVTAADLCSTAPGCGLPSSTYLVTVQVPAGVTPGLAVPVVLSMDGVPSNMLTVAVAASALAPVSALPGTGSALTHTFVFTFQDPDGYADLGVQDVLINNVIDGVNACYVAFVPSGTTSGSVYLVDDAGDSQGPFAGGFVIGGNPDAYAQNSQCTVNATGSSVVASGNSLVLALSITFSAGFAGNKVTYMAAGSNTLPNSGWQALGTWNVPGTAPAGPAVGGMTPGRSATAGQTYTFTFTDTDGYADLGLVDILINNAIDGINACYVAVVPSGASSGSLYLVADAGGGYAGSFVLGGNAAASASNSQCTIAANGSSLNASGDTLTLTLAMTFNSGFAGNQVFYLSAGSAGQSGWQSVGSVTVP